MIIREREVDVDVYEEIMNYEWKHGRRKGDEFVCCSPFRDESHPSFSINLISGAWIDFGGSDDYWKKGNFIKLLAYLENISYEEAEEMLLDSYGVVLDNVDEIELIINIQNEEEEAEPRTFTREELKPFLFRNKQYLLNRGISEETMKKYIVGYDNDKEAVAFFWRHWKTGKVVTVKFRSIKGKQFYYIAGGQQVKNHIFGLYDIIQKKAKEVFIVESEIDAMYLDTLGYDAVALGGSRMSPEQKRLILLSGIETLVIATDNDAAGMRIRNAMIQELNGKLELKVLRLPAFAKDVNDLNSEQIDVCVKSVADVVFKFSI